MKELIAAGGSALLIPAVLFGLVLYVIRGLFGLHGRRSQHRRDFLEIWESSRSQDDLWLEVAIRHLFGTYLPARVIRLAMAQPDKSQALLDLCELWPLFRFDPDSQTVSWLHARHDATKKRRWGRYLLLIGYFCAASVAALSALAAFRSGPDTFFGWTYGVLATVMGCLSFVCLMREETIKTAATVGDYWFRRINGRTCSASTTSVVASQAPRAEPESAR